jgi:hypothetical protein
MRKPAYLVFTTLSLVIGFGAGYYYRATNTPVTAEIEDYALTNVLEDVGYAHYLAKGNFEAMRSMIDVSLHSHLSRVRAHTGHSNDAAAEEARIRILNSVAVLWDRYPPFKAAEFQPNESNSSWLHEWSADHKLNLALLKQAKETCAAKPALNCKAQAPQTRLPSEQK